MPRVMMLANQETSSELRLISGMIMLDRGMDAPPSILTKLTIKELHTCLASVENMFTITDTKQ